MGKYLAIINGTEIKKYNLERKAMPMVVIGKHLYDINDRRFFRIQKSPDTVMFTNLESTQAYGCEWQDPDDLIKMLDTSPSSGGRHMVGSIGVIARNPMLLVYGAVAVVILVTVLGGIKL